MKKYLSNLKRAGLLALVTAGSLLTTSTPSKAEVNTYEELKVEQNRQEQANVQEKIEERLSMYSKMGIPINVPGETRMPSMSELEIYIQNMGVNKK